MSVPAVEKKRKTIIYPHESHDHPFVKDFYLGISKQEAERRIELVLN